MVAGGLPGKRNNILYSEGDSCSAHLPVKAGALGA